jgi:3-hydroxyisobutyrate dehydrogenase
MKGWLFLWFGRCCPKNELLIVATNCQPRSAIADYASIPDEKHGRLKQLAEATKSVLGDGRKGRSPRGTEVAGKTRSMINPEKRMSQTIGFLGTGLMGLPMAQRAIEQGHRVMAYNRTITKLANLQGGQVATDPAQVIDFATTIFLMLTDVGAIRSLLTPLHPQLTGKTIVQMGTIAPEESRELEQWINAAQGYYLEAPVLGSIPEAKAGTLLVMGGASPEDWQRTLPLLQIFGAAPRLIGPVGSGAALKLALNQMIGALTLGFAQSLSYIQGQGVDRAAFMDILRASALYAPTFDKKLDRLVERNYTNPNFPTKHLAKDLRLFAQSAQPLGLNLTGVDSLQGLVDGAIELGWADGDYAALIEALLPDSKSP